MSDIVPTAIQPSLVFLHGRVRGDPPCGSMVGSYTLEQENLKVDSGALITSPCFYRADDGQHEIDLERADTPSFNALDAVRRIAADGSRLDLLDASGQIQMVLAPAPEPP